MLNARLNLRGSEPSPGDARAPLERTANLLDPATVVRAGGWLTKLKSSEVEIGIAKNDALVLLLVEPPDSFTTELLRGSRYPL